MSSEPSSDMECEDEDEDETEAVLNDELPILSLVFLYAGNQDDAPQDDIPDELDDEALAEYAAEQELLEGLDPDEIFSLSDLDEEPEASVRASANPSEEEEILWRKVDKGKQRAYANVDNDVDMDL
ncbi:hypothetical protein EIP86_008238 [Pleurotus ostreatoroseus]|nr:hypothetical protein EIP86_008238 [Pleurotus ostreatoroseus]